MRPKYLRLPAQRNSFEIIVSTCQLRINMWRKRKLQPVAVERDLDRAGVGAEVGSIDAEKMESGGRGRLMAAHAGGRVQSFEQTSTRLHKPARLCRKGRSRDDLCGLLPVNNEIERPVGETRTASGRIAQCDIRRQIVGQVEDAAIDLAQMT